MPCTSLKCPERPGRTLLAASAWFLIAPVVAGAEQLWSVHALGIKVGELRLEVKEDTASYQLRSLFETTGVAGAVARIRFDIRSQGRREGDSYRPTTYRGDIDTGRRQSATSLEFSGPAPRKTQGIDAPAVPISDSALKGAIDPMTMMWLVLRDRPEPCAMNGTQFDGTRLVAIRLIRSEMDGERLVCHGEYHRLGGYTAEELAEITVTPMIVTFERNGEDWRAVQVWVRTRHGPATVKRRDSD